MIEDAKRSALEPAWSQFMAPKSFALRIRVRTRDDTRFVIQVKRPWAFGL